MKPQRSFWDMKAKISKMFNRTLKNNSNSWWVNFVSRIRYLGLSLYPSGPNKIGFSSPQLTMKPHRSFWDMKGILSKILNSTLKSDFNSWRVNFISRIWYLCLSWYPSGLKKIGFRWPQLTLKPQRSFWDMIAKISKCSIEH